MENTERKQEEMTISEGALEFCIDHDHITIPVTRFEKLIDAESKLGNIDNDHIIIPISRFEELVKAEVKLDMTEQIYKTVESYSMKSRLEVLFGPLPEKDDDNA